MTEKPFAAGPLRGHRRGSGPPALLLHGGAAVPDYLDGVADELAGTFTTYAEVVIVPGCGHFPWVECPGSVRRSVERFLGD